MNDSTTMLILNELITIKKSANRIAEILAKEDRPKAIKVKIRKSSIKRKKK